MATLEGFNEQAWFHWVESRPENIQELCRKVPASKLYRLKESGHRVTIYSYQENGTVAVAVLGKYNLVAFERRVFGIKPEDLEECEFPTRDEPLGALLTKQEDIDAHIESIKAGRN